MPMGPPLAGMTACWAALSETYSPASDPIQNQETCVSLAALGQAAKIDRVMGPGLGGGGGLGGGLWPNGQAAGLQTPGLWVQVPGCAQGFR